MFLHIFIFSENAINTGNSSLSIHPGSSKWNTPLEKVQAGNLFIKLRIIGFQDFFCNSTDPTFPWYYVMAIFC